MPGQRYSEEFKQQALMARQDTPATQVARELGIPPKTLYKWTEAARQHPAEPFVGRGHLRTEAQQIRDLQRQLRRYKATTNSRHGFPVAESILARQFVATRPHQVWMADIAVLRDR